MNDRFCANEFSKNSKREKDRFKDTHHDYIEYVTILKLKSHQVVIKNLLLFLSSTIIKIKQIDLQREFIKQCSCSGRCRRNLSIKDTDDRR